MFFDVKNLDNNISGPQNIIKKWAAHDSFVDPRGLTWTNPHP